MNITFATPEKKEKKYPTLEEIPNGSIFKWATN